MRAQGPRCPVHNYPIPEVETDRCVGQTTRITTENVVPKWGRNPLDRSDTWMSFFVITGLSNSPTIPLFSTHVLYFEMNEKAMKMHV